MCADIEVACYGYEGVDAVKDSLNAGLNCSTEDMPIKVSATCTLQITTFYDSPLSFLISLTQQISSSLTNLTIYR